MVASSHQLKQLAPLQVDHKGQPYYTRADAAHRLVERNGGACIVGATARVALEQMIALAPEAHVSRGVPLWSPSSSPSPSLASTPKAPATLLALLPKRTEEPHEQ